MATLKKEKSLKQSQESTIIPLKYQHIAAVVLIFLSLVVFFSELVFEGKVFVAADTIASKSFETLIDDAAKENTVPLWNPYIFCGMPGVGSMMVHGDRIYDFSAYLLGRGQILFGIVVNNSDVGWQLFYYFILGTGVYFFVWHKVKNKIAAVISGLAVMHSTFIIILVMVGHMTKVPVIAFFPWIFLAVEYLREKFSIWSSLALVVLIHFLLLPGHIQMIFYVYFALGVYYLFFLIRALITKEDWKGILRSGSILAVASGLAFAMTGDQYLATLEYSKYSMRGADPIVRSQQAQEKGASNGGLDYEYATQWSFSPGEMLTFVIPSAYGFGVSVPYQGPETNNQAAKLPLYFGPQPWTDAPQFMGVIIVVLAGIGFWRKRRDPFVQYSGILVLVSLLVSFGKEFPLVYDLMFNYFPMFNKFRIPSMMLILVQMIVPMVAGYGVVSLMRTEENNAPRVRKYFEYSLIGLGVLLVISLVAKNLLLSVYEIFVPNAEQLLGVKFGNNAPVVYKIVTGMISNEITVGLLLMLVVLGGFYLYQKQKIKLAPLTIGLIVVVLFDLWRVNFKPMEMHPRTKTTEAFSTPEYIKYLQNDTTQYRTLLIENGQPTYDNTFAYYRIQSAYGYSGTKMRQIQDTYDVAGIGNPLLWGLMNVKYIISDRPDSNQVLMPVFRGEKAVMYNRTVLPRVFFVNRYEVKEGLQILQNIKEMNFIPTDVAYVMNDIGKKIDVPQTGSEVRYTHFGIHDITLHANATGNNLLFLSEAWYPEGWKAYIDGNETPIYRLNYMFRGVIVPQGEHTITMKFTSSAFSLGKQLSLWINILVLVGIGYFVVVWLKSSKFKQNG